MMASVLHNMGIMHYYLSNYDQALAIHAKSLAISRALGNDIGVANSLFNLGISWEGKGDYKKALEYIFESLAIQEKMGNRYSLAKIFNSIGLIHSEHQKFEKTFPFNNSKMPSIQSLN